MVGTVPPRPHVTAHGSCQVAVPPAPSRPLRGGVSRPCYTLLSYHRAIVIYYYCLRCWPVPAVRQVGNPVQRDPSVCSEEEYKNFLLAYIDLRYLDYRRAAREGLRLRA